VNTFIKIKPVLAAVLLAGSFGAMTAHAEGLYIGGALGTPHYDDNINGVDGGHGSGLSGKAFGGYQITPNVAVEAGYADMGHIHSDSGTVNGRSEYLDAVGLLPLGHNWSALGSLGVAHTSLHTANGNDDGVGPKIGLGAEYAINQNVSLRGEWEQYRPSVFGDHPAIGQYTFGVRAGF
jgi:OOP family OmpA-OmpF porin